MRRAFRWRMYLDAMGMLRRAHRRLLVVAVGGLLVALAVGLSATGASPGWEVLRGAFHAEQVANYSSGGQAPVAPQRPIEAAGVIHVPAAPAPAP